MSHISFNQVVYIVTGGSGGISSAFNPEEKPGDRTETFVEGSSSWTLEIARLPSERVYLKVLSLYNRVFASGNFLHFDNTFSRSSLSFLGGTQVSTPIDEILEFNSTTMQWREIGKMGAARGQHTMTSVDVTDFGCSL